MPMTYEEETISLLMGSKSIRPIVGMSRTKPTMAFAFWPGAHCCNHFRNKPVVLGIEERLIAFDPKTASWKSIPDPGRDPGKDVLYMREWRPEDEEALERLRSM